LRDHREDHEEALKLVSGHVTLIDTTESQIDLRDGLKQQHTSAMQEGQQAVNRDEDSYQLRHAARGLRPLC